MARFEITAPDGRRYEITTPDGTSQEKAMEFFQGQLGRQSSKPYEGYGEYALDIGRNAVQGATLGFGDEITAGVRSVLPKSIGGATYDEALEAERAGIDRLYEHHPETALASQFAGGIAVPGLGAARGVQAATGLVRKSAVGAGYGAGFGAAGGFGVGEDGFANRLQGAGTGAVVGSAVGGTLPSVTSLVAPAAGRAATGIQRAVQTVRDDEQAAQLYLADRLRQAGITEADIGRELAAGRAAAQFRKNGVAELPEAIGDVTPTTQRLLRGIKVGGDADDLIVPTLSERQAGNIDFSRGSSFGGQFGRVFDQLRLAFNLSGKSLRQEVDEITSKRDITATKKFGAARANSQPFDLDRVLQRYSFEAMNLVDPGQRALLNRVIEMASQKPFITSGKGGARFGTSNIDRLDQWRKAVGDLLDSEAVGRQGNLKRLLTKMKNDVMDVAAGGSRAAPTQNAEYFEALQDYATRSELIDAAELGKAIARGAEKLTPAVWSGLSRAEKRIASKAFLENLRSKAGNKAQGPATDFTAQLRSPNVQDALRIMLPPQAGKTPDFPGGSRQRLAELARREQRTLQTNQMVLGNSSTAEKLTDATDVGRMARVARYIRERGGPIQAAVSALSEQIERFGAVKGRRARYLAQKLLTTDPAEQEAFLKEVTRAYGDQRAARIRQAMRSFTLNYERGVAAVAARDQATSEQDGQR